MEQKCLLCSKTAGALNICETVLEISHKLVKERVNELLEGRHLATDYMCLSCLDYLYCIEQKEDELRAVKKDFLSIYFTGNVQMGLKNKMYNNEIQCNKWDSNALEDLDFNDGNEEVEDVELSYKLDFDDENEEVEDVELSYRLDINDDNEEVEDVKLSYKIALNQLGDGFLPFLEPHTNGLIQRRFICRYNRCGKRYRNYNKWSKHVNDHLTDYVKLDGVTHNLLYEPLVFDDQSFLCKFCFDKFSTKVNWLNHLKDHFVYPASDACYFSNCNNFKVEPDLWPDHIVDHLNCEDLLKSGQAAVLYGKMLKVIHRQNNNDEKECEEIKISSDESKKSKNDKSEIVWKEKRPGKHVRYQCTASFCGKRFRNYTNWENHIIEHFINETKCRKGASEMKNKEIECCVCLNCAKTFVCSEELEKHLKKCVTEDVTNKLLFGCLLCSEKFGKCSELMSHLNLQEYVCNDCNHGVATRGEFLSHIRKHVSCFIEQRDKQSSATKIKVECPICSETYDTSAKYKMHYKQTHIVEPVINGDETFYHCLHCTTVCSNLLSFRRHLKLHWKSETSYDKRLRAGGKLKEHYRGDSEERKFLCSLCGNSYRFKGSLDAHIVLKHDIYAAKYQCDECSKKLTSKKRLEEHMRIHTGEKPFQCCKCGKNFRCKMLLQRHETTHSSARAVCQLCHKEFKAVRYVKKHVREVHQGKYQTYECKMCSLTFKYYPQYAKHKTVHTGELPIQCRYCLKRFVTFTQRLVHERKEHPHEVNEREEFQQKLMADEIDNHPQEPIIVPL